MSRMLVDKENEITNFVKSENEVVQKLKHKLHELEEENKLLQVIVYSSILALFLSFDTKK